MNVIAVNGGPRKKGNTATLLQKALDGPSEILVSNVSRNQSKTGDIIVDFGV